MSPGLLEIVARARDTLTERQPLTVPEEAVRQQLTKSTFVQCNKISQVKYCLLGCYFGLLWDKHSCLASIERGGTEALVSELQTRFGQFYKPQH